MKMSVIIIAESITSILHGMILDNVSFPISRIDEYYDGYIVKYLELKEWSIIC
jgi:hypothetical protein